MRTISRTTRFKKDYKCESKGQYRDTLDADLAAVLSDLVRDLLLPERFHDHPLTGEWKDHRDCHIRPDLVLIYRMPNADSLQLVRLGSHSELSL